MPNLDGRRVVTRRRAAWLAIVGVAALAAALAWPVARRYYDGLSLVFRAGDVQGPLRHIADLNVVPVTNRLLQIPSRPVPIRARVYAPSAGRSRHTLLLVSGMHPSGIDEPRLIALSTILAEANVTVVTPEIPELSRFEITSTLTNQIEEAAAWLAGNSTLTPAGRIGLMGVSFSGGLAMVAAGRPRLRDRLLYVMSFGGHDDLGRVLEYYCSGTAHDFGVAVLLLNTADRLVPADQVADLREALLRFLLASYRERLDKAGAAHDFAALRDLARRFPEPAATLLRYVNNRDVAQLGPRLLPYIGPYVDAAALSPSRSPAPAAPVFLLHGSSDRVIPASESQHLADRLRGHIPVHLLLTDLISHAEADQPPKILDMLRLAGFWGNLLAQ